MPKVAIERALTPHPTPRRREEQAVGAVGGCKLGPQHRCQGRRHRHDPPAFRLPVVCLRSFEDDSLMRCAPDREGVAVEIADLQWQHLT